ncbi:MAG: hypothetical protein MHPSP_001447, partial [Paramarteilia canceri]
KIPENFMQILTGDGWIVNKVNNTIEINFRTKNLRQSSNIFNGACMIGFFNDVPLAKFTISSTNTKFELPLELDKDRLFTLCRTVMTLKYQCN